MPGTDSILQSRPDLLSQPSQQQSEDARDHGGKKIRVALVAALVGRAASSRVSLL